MAGTGKSLSELERSFYAKDLRSEYSVTVRSNMGINEVKRELMVRALRDHGYTENTQRMSLSQLEREFLIAMVARAGGNTGKLRYSLDIWQALNANQDSRVGQSVDDCKRIFFEERTTFFI